MLKGLVFNIQRFSIHDGPGIRTTVFFKGCSLRCFWCHNPESIHHEPQLQLFLQKCIGCGKCFENCPVRAHRMVNGERIFLRELCISCGRCAEDCYAEALAIAGKWMTVREVMDEVIKDKPFYENSGGGVTLSGGEPLLQAGFVRELLEESKREGLHTAVDTAGNVPWEAFESVLPFVDLFLYDVKVADEELHRQVTGVSNTRILDNLKRLAGKGTTILIRIPVIPGVNDTPEEMERIGLLIKDLDNIEYADLLPFHGLGESKYASLGMEYKAKGYQPPEPELMDSLAEILGEMDIRVKIGRK
ncbi:MAG: glycyl-radical enzyme activating protein [Clostridiales bacterium]|jgi:pyruvate formate lyase activating enzyme|nr:glycyl-radical enzyme activating protein [Clostridiales bacterium]